MAKFKVTEIAKIVLECQDEKELIAVEEIMADHLPGFSAWKTRMYNQLMKQRRRQLLARKN
jgi:hypothetical protein